MTIIIKNRDYMFCVFDKNSQYYLTAVAGGVAMYDLTIRLTEQEVASFQEDENKAIATATDLIKRTSAYEGRLVNPSIDPV